MNIVILLGRLARDPESQGEGETKRVKFTIAVDKFKEGADFINCIVFGKQAENVLKYCQKGTQVLVEGSLNSYSFEREDGERISGMNVSVRTVQFLSKPNGTPKGQQKPQQKNTTSKYSNKDFEEFANESELPF